MADYYDLLSVGRDADADTIKRALVWGSLSTS